MKNCSLCGNEYNSYGDYCVTCYAYLKRHPNGAYPIPKEGEVLYAPNGDVICHICGRAYKRLGSHIKNHHQMSQTEYRDRFKLYRSTRLSNVDYISMMKQYNDENKDIVVAKNLLEKGTPTRLSEKRMIKERRKYGKPIKTSNL